jgi:hypothetical protein
MHEMNCSYFEIQNLVFQGLKNVLENEVDLKAFSAAGFEFSLLL